MKTEMNDDWAETNDEAAHHFAFLATFYVVNILHFAFVQTLLTPAAPAHKFNPLSAASC
jgi:hypothetical protein